MLIKKSFSLSGFLVLPTLCCSTLTPVWAQDALEIKTLPTIEVRPSTLAPQYLRPRNITTGTEAANIDTPYSVTEVPIDLVGAQAGRTLQDALRNVPGAQADTGFNGSHTQFFVLRGAIADSGTGSNRILRDGARLSNYPFVAPFIESLDVLRGPGAALGLRSEPGGAVNLMSKQPELANFSSIGVSAGTSGAMESSADVNRLLSSEDELAARLILTRSAASEWRHVPDKLDGVKLGIAKNQGALYHLRAGLEATNQTYQPDYGIPALNGRPVDVPRDRQLGEPWDNSTTNNRILDMHGDVALTDTARINVDVTHMEARSTSIKSGIFGDPKPITSTTPYGTWGRFAAYEPGTDRMIDSVATTLDSIHRWGGVEHQVMWGLDYYREILNQPTLTIPAASSPNLNVFNPVFGLVVLPNTPLLAGATTKENLESTAASVQDQIDLGDWKLIAGVRFVQQNFLYGTPGTKSITESQWLPKLALLRKLTDDDSIYATAAQGMSPNQVSSSTNQSVPSRLSSQLELGWKSLWQGGRLASDIALYQLDQSNMISSDQSTPLNTFDFTVSGSARSQGLEASLSGDITDRMIIKIAYAYTYARYLDNSVYPGAVVPNVAANNLSLWGQYQWPIQSDLNWFTGLGIYAQSDRFADEANSVVLPGYARADITQTWRKTFGGSQSVEVQLAVRNLFDVNYYVSSHLHVSRWITPGEGRNASITMNYRF